MLYINDKKYRKIVKCITKNDAFKRTYNIEHHGISRMEHLTKVSYYSYNIAKKLHWDYESVARGALLHDFYLDGDERSAKKKLMDTFIHPKKALNTTKKYFDINKMEENIIISHMFPLYFSLPKYKESILVNLVDKVIGGCEMFREYKYKARYKFTYTVFVFMLFVFCE